jgi:exodeoxyribonuclease VII small subunit
MTTKPIKPTTRKASSAPASPPDEARATTQTVTDAAGFEAAMRELETLVERLETGDLGLEESLTVFERGIGLARACQQALDRAEQKVQVLTAGAASEQGPEPSRATSPDLGDSSLYDQS